MSKYTILASMKDDVTKKIKAIIRKCQKNNIPCNFTISDIYEKQTVDKKTGKSYSVSVCDIDVNACLKFKGWTALGVVQRKDGIVLCYFDDASLIKKYKDTDYHCDHCKKHVHRNSVVILQNESGIQKVVGTSCVKEFTCGLDGNIVVAFNEYTRFLSDKDAELQCLLQGESLDYYPISAFYDSPCVSRTYNVAKVLSLTSKIIDEYGWEPAASLNPTWKVVQYYFDDKNISVNDEAKNVIKWIKGLSDDELYKSSYLFNIKQIIDADYCTLRHFSLIVSLIPTFRKSEYSKSLNESNKQVSNYVANIGDKITETVTYISTISYMSQFGTGYFHLFKDDNGNIFKWSTGNGRIPVGKGSKIIIAGKVKDHEEYKGEKQTVITRCKFEHIKQSLNEYEHENGTFDLNVLDIIGA